MSEYQHITDRSSPSLTPVIDERYTHHVSSRCKCNCCKKTKRAHGFYTEIAKVEGEGNFHKAMKILGNETRNNNWKDVLIYSEVHAQGNWGSVKSGPPWVVVGFDTRYSKDTRFTGRKVISYD